MTEETDTPAWLAIANGPVGFTLAPFAGAAVGALLVRYARRRTYRAVMDQLHMDLAVARSSWTDDTTPSP